MLTVKDLMEVLQSSPQDAIVMVPATDHTYRALNGVQVTTAIRSPKYRTYMEDYGGELNNEDNWVRVNCVIFGGY